MRRRVPSSSHDDGVALVMVLLFVMVSGVLITALLNQSFTTFSAARVAADVENRTYAAGGGLDWGIQQVRQGSLLNGGPRCATFAAPADALTLPGSPGLNGRTLSVTCRVTDGQDVGAGGWAVYITRASGGITTPAAPSGARTIRGPVHNPGSWSIDGASELRVEAADAIGPATACALPAGVVIATAPPYAYSCGAVDTEPLPPVPVDLTGDLASLPAQPPAGDGADTGCRVFSPGEYAQVPDLLPRSAGVNYFRPGIYHLTAPGAFSIDDADVVGGIPTPGDAAVLPIDTPACPAEPNTNGRYGVVLVLDATSRLEVTNHGRLELHRYVDGSGSGLSVLQTTSSLLLPSVDAAPGEFADLVLHGNVYTPAAAVRAASNGDVRFTGGVVATSLELASTFPIGSPQVEATVGTGARTVEIVSRTNQVGTERDLTASATVEYANDGARTLLVRAWTVSP